MYSGDIREPMWCYGSTLARNARDVGSIPALDTMFNITFVAPMPLVAATRILYKLHALWLLNLPCVCKCKAITCVYLIINIKGLTIPAGRVSISF